MSFVSNRRPDGAGAARAAGQAAGAAAERLGGAAAVHCPGQLCGSRRIRLPQNSRGVALLKHSSCTCSFHKTLERLQANYAALDASACLLFHEVLVCNCGLLTLFQAQ